jgi:hypothetical protein
MTGVQQVADNVATDESACAKDQNPHAFSPMSCG